MLSHCSTVRPHTHVRFSCISIACLQDPQTSGQYSAEILIGGLQNWKIMILQVTAQKFLEESGGQRAGEMVQQIKQVTKVLASQV